MRDSFLISALAPTFVFCFVLKDKVVHSGIDAPRLGMLPDASNMQDCWTQEVPLDSDTPQIGYESHINGRADIRYIHESTHKSGTVGRKPLHLPPLSAPALLAFGTPGVVSNLGRKFNT